MNIQAIFTDGATELTVHGLSRWDYGRILEIHHPDLPAVLEVHFAAVGDVEAIVRAVAGINGVAETAIPDTLLEQTRPILAWAYVIGETSGETMLTVVLPVKDRARPTPAAPIPEEVGDKYTEAVAAVNAQVEALKAGNVTVANALKATQAETAGSATHAGFMMRVLLFWCSPILAITIQREKRSYSVLKTNITTPPIPPTEHFPVLSPIATKPLTTPVPQTSSGRRVLWVTQHCLLFSETPKMQKNMWTNVLLCKIATEVPAVFCMQLRRMPPYRGNSMHGKVWCHQHGYTLSSISLMCCFQEHSDKFTTWPKSPTSRMRSHRRR